jgi:tRNA threonylcarbamoyladenosine biosynthesis protein TsaB
VKVIAIDTAARASSWVLLTDASGLVLDQREIAGRELDSRLPGALVALLDSEVGAVVVLTGPGSYTGVRAGMAAALGMASARGLPLHGLGNLAALAAAAGTADGGAFVVLADAGRGGVYTADFEQRGGRAVQLGPVRRRESAPIPGGRRLIAAGAIGGLEMVLVPQEVALAAAVPLALAGPPLAALGLAASHAEPAEGGP